MAKEIVVNVGERETRIAVTEDGKLVELHVERSERVVGSLYKCRVANVLPGMDAAFVDIGLERNAFLYVGDVLPTNDDSTTSNDAVGENRSGNGNDRGRRYGRDRRNGGEASTRPALPTPVAELHETVTEIAGELIEQAEASSADAPIVDAPPVTSETDTTDNVEGLHEPATHGDEQHHVLTASVYRREMEIEDLPNEIIVDIEAQPHESTTAVEDIPVTEEEVMEAVAEALAEVDDDEEDEEDDGAEDEGGEADETPGEPGADGRPQAPRPPRRNTRRSALRNQRIKDVLKIGQELLVQVIKGPRSTKGARVSTRISLPGRYLVLMPEADNLGVSRKIEDAKERDRLKKIGDKLREPGFGLIIRTEAEEKTEQELRQDHDFLIQSWREIQDTVKRVRGPALVQQDLTLLYQTIRDIFGSDVSKLVIDDPAEYEKANELLERISPKLKGRIFLYDGVQPIFDNYGLEAEIDRSLRRKVFLKSGGSLIIDETEALTVIDVNTSKNVGSSSLAETILKTNLDAANEIARQLRLRDIGGIIVIDFIDMNNARDKQSVVKALELALKRDRSRTKISNISPLGLIEMTRKRTGETLSGQMSDECPYCKGRGHLPSAESVSLLIERDLRRQSNSQQNNRKDSFLVTCHPDVAELLIGPDGANIEMLERQIQRALFIRADEDSHVEKATIDPGDVAEFEKNRLNYRRAQVVECRIARSQLKEAGKCIGWANGYMLDLDDGARFIGQKAKVRITDVRRSFAVGQLVPGTARPD